MLIVKNVIYPVEFRSTYVKEHLKYENDLREIIEASGFEGRFRGIYEQRLKYLERCRRLCTQRRGWFEQLKHVDEELYAIIIKSQKNIRILFCFMEYTEVEHAVLLYPFEEKEKGKRKSKDSYGDAITIAMSRLRGGLRGV